MHGFTESAVAMRGRGHAEPRGCSLIKPAGRGIAGTVNRIGDRGGGLQLLRHALAARRSAIGFWRQAEGLAKQPVEMKRRETGSRRQGFQGWNAPLVGNCRIDFARCRRDCGKGDAVGGIRIGRAALAGAKTGVSGCLGI